MRYLIPEALGCKALLEKVKELRPRYHIFGHIHASYGTLKMEETIYMNASVLDSYRGPVNAPMVFEI